jgi:hypothetical protein
MVRAITIFVVGVGVVLGFGAFSRGVLHLDCLGPYIDGWGCLSAPLPQELPGNSVELFYFGVGLAGFVVCLVVKDLVWGLAGSIAGRLFPGWIRRATAPEPQSYRIR